MPVFVALLRGVNVGGHNKIKMDVLRGLCESLKCENPQTYVQSGNVVFRTKEKNPATLAKRIEDAIEKELGFRPAVILRTAAEMKDVVAKNPFAKRQFDPAKLAVIFFADRFSTEVKKQVLELKVGPEEIKAADRELYIYFPDGMGRSKLPAAMGRVTKNAGTARNWNSVTKLLEMAEELRD